MSPNVDATWLAIGWTMLHFLWVGVLIGVGAALALWALDRASAGVRYGVALASLALLALAPAVIGWREGLAARGVDRIPQEPSVQAATGMPLPGRRRPDETPAPIARPGLAGPAGSRATIARVGPDVDTPRPSSPASRLDALASRLPWLWLVGSPITFAWLALGLAGAERLRRHGAAVSDGELPRLCRRLAGELGIARDVAVAVCERLAAPVLVGVVRPMILLPAAALGGWGPDQLEMVLLHELAHVRRWDNLVNLLQRLVESALFFHPAVWIVSGWVRREREHCCDAVVVARTGRARAYAETLLALAEPGRTPGAAVAMAGNDLVARIGRILNLHPEGHAMKLPRGLLALTAAILIVPGGWTFSRARLAAPTAEVPVQAKADPKKPAPQSIQGKTIDEWLAALKDRDPTVRKRAVEVLGERSVAPAVIQSERSRLHTAVASLARSEKDREVWRSAAFFTDLFDVSGFPEEVKRLREERRRAIDPTRTPIRLVDAQGRPVPGAVASTYFQKIADRESGFTPPEPTERATSDAQGDLTLKLEIPGHLDAWAIYAIRPGRGRPLVGLHRVTREEVGEPITIVMRPACRVLFRIDSTGLADLEEKYHAELVGPGWWRAAYILLGVGMNNSPRPLFASSTKGEFEFLLPPGRVTLFAYGEDARGIERPIEIGPDDRELLLGTLDLPPSLEAQQGRFPGHYRVRRIGADGSADVAFRRIHYMPFTASLYTACDVAFSPDGKLLATAHAYNADPGELRLWDMATGAAIARWPVADRGVDSVAFSPDGKLLAGRVHAMADPRSSRSIVLWDVASRRELRTVGGPAGRIAAMAFAPDGKLLVTSGADGVARFWDVATGRQTRWIDGAGSGRVLAFSPDGRTLAMNGAGLALTLWDLAGNRLRATLEPQAEWFSVQSVAFAPDGRTLAAAGMTLDWNGAAQKGQVRLYDLSREPFARRAVLTFEGNGFGRDPANDTVTMCSDVAFTPDGRRVVGIAMHKVRIWDAATGAEQVAFEERGSSSPSDRLAVSPDGRWLAITRPGLVSVQDIGSTAP